MSPWGELEVSAEEYYTAVKSGLVPVSNAMRENLGTAIEFIDSSMTTANENIAAGYSDIASIVQGVVPDVMELGTITEEEADLMTKALLDRLDPAVGAVTQGILESGEQFDTWAVESGEATGEIGQSLEGLHMPMTDVQVKVGETEKAYGKSMTQMEKATNMAFKAIDKTVKERMKAVRTTVNETLTKINEKMKAQEEKFLKFGHQMIQALIDGILDKQGAAERAMIQLVRAMIKAAKEAAGMDSPSRLFKGMGQDVVAGFIHGLHSMRPALQAEMEMTLAPAIQVAAPSPTASPVFVQGGHTYNFSLSAQYAQLQSPASILDDLAAMQMLAQARG